VFSIDTARLNTKKEWDLLRHFVNFSFYSLTNSVVTIQAVWYVTMWLSVKVVKRCFEVHFCLHSQGYVGRQFRLGLRRSDTNQNIRIFLNFSCGSKHVLRGTTFLWNAEVQSEDNHKKYESQVNNRITNMNVPALGSLFYLAALSYHFHTARLSH
jgi:hypothetical protein